jgi:two-component system, OmpR family, sensor histidine kinase BaeS
MKKNSTIKIGIAFRLFFTIAFVTILAVPGTFYLMYTYAEKEFREFTDFLAVHRQARLSQIISSLADVRDSGGKWTFDNHNPQHVDPVPSNRSVTDNTGTGIGRVDEKKTPGPILILDADKKPVYGMNSWTHEKYSFGPIIVDGKTVGYIGVVAPRQFLYPSHIEFLKNKRLPLILYFSGIVLMVGFISFLLSWRLVKPIKELAVATAEIASGRYSKRVPISTSDEIGQLAQGFNAMALTLEKNEEERRKWVADISHELRTPVTILQAEIEGLQAGIIPLTAEAIRSLHSETTILQHLIEDLYQLSLCDLGAMNYRKEYIDPVEVLNDSLENYRTDFARKDITCAFKTPSDLKVRILADRQRIKQIFMNLLENSLRYTDDGGELCVEVQMNGDLLIIEFKDSKPGVSAQDRGKLFDRFYRVEESRSRETGGAGLGLAICKNIVTAHEGWISAHESPLGGLMIRVLLPVFEGPYE